MLKQLLLTRKIAAKRAELDKLKAPVETFFVTRERGAGRPTKKDRREMEKLWDAFD